MPHESPMHPAPRSRGWYSRQSNGSWFQLVGVLLVALVALTLADQAARLPNFNPDESRWISRAHFLAELADPLGTHWTDRYTTFGQPPLGSYVMGIGLLAHGRDLRTNPPWDFSQPWEVNIALGRKPVPEDLRAGRHTSAILVALTSVAIVAIARVFVPSLWAIAAGFLYAVHPFSSYIGSIAMSDAVFGLLIALAALAAVALANRPGWPPAMLLGVALGLGGATKLSPLVLAPALAAGALTLLAITWIRRRSLPPLYIQYAAAGVVVAATAAATFIVSYPYLWPDPIGRTRQLFVFRAQEMAAQASDWPEMAVPDRGEALRRVAMNFSERFSISNSVFRFLTSQPAPDVVQQFELLIPLTGIIVMIASAARAGPFSARALVLMVLGGQCVVTILGMRSEFDRYHLPMALLGAVAAVVALDWITNAATKSRARIAPSLRWRARWRDQVPISSPLDWIRGES